MSSDVTTNFTTTTSSVIRLNPEYLKTTPGIIKLGATGGPCSFDVTGREW